MENNDHERIHILFDDADPITVSYVAKNYPQVACIDRLGIIPKYDLYYDVSRIWLG